MVRPLLPLPLPLLPLWPSLWLPLPLPLLPLLPLKLLLLLLRDAMSLLRRLLQLLLLTLVLPPLLPPVPPLLLRLVAPTVFVVTARRAVVDALRSTVAGPELPVVASGVFWVPTGCPWTCCRERLSKAVATEILPALLLTAGSLAGLFFTLATSLP